MQQGTVKAFNAEKGIGFITPDAGGADLFFHHTAIQDLPVQTLDEGQRVNFVRLVVQIQEGPQAIKVVAV
jgi:CspA family cold shock protein